MFNAEVVLIEDKASGTQLIQELITDGCHGVTRYQPTGDKTMRLHAQTAMIENGFVHLPREAGWRAEYLHELTVFPGGKHDDQVVIDDPLKPEEALSQTQRQAANEWYDHTLYSRLNDKRHGAIVIIMQRLHEDDLVGHVLAQETWEVVRFPAIAEADEMHEIETIWGAQTFCASQPGRSNTS